MPQCSNCGHDNKPENKFCQACGAPLAPPQDLRCPQCATPYEPVQRFCKNCGAALVQTPGLTTPEPAPVQAAPPATVKPSILGQLALIVGITALALLFLPLLMGPSSEFTYALADFNDDWLGIDAPLPTYTIVLAVSGLIMAALDRKATHSKVSRTALILSLVALALFVLTVGFLGVLDG
jgi:hypothetical protein